ncbi:MAG: cyclic nucleotide-binding domain-containing protein [Myxococcales bacterium]|nr:cyclic nucleotide-binding domain-containing protein [Myxococcales bacterium]
MVGPSPAVEQLIRSIPLFSLVEPGEMGDILKLLKPVELRPGQVLFREATPATAMWLLGTGAEISISTTPEGAKRPVVVGYARPGEAVGEMALIDQGLRSATGVVMQGGPAQQIEAREFESLRAAYRPAAFKVLRRMCMDLCAKLRATSDRLAPQSQQVVVSPGLPEGRQPKVKELEEFPPFRELPEVVKLALVHKLKLIEVDGVTPLFSEGEEAGSAFMILQGEVIVGRNGRTFANLEAGSMFGMVSAIDQGRRSASCVSSGPARLLVLSDRDFDALFAGGNRFAFQLVDLVARQLVAHLRSANRLLPRLGELARPPPVAKVAAAREEDTLPEAEILPLELEIELDDLVPSQGAPA